MLLNRVLKQGRARTYLWLCWVRKDMNMIHVGEMYKSVRTARSIARFRTYTRRSSLATLTVRTEICRIYGTNAVGAGPATP